jgi:hypothetical protein
MLVSQIRGVQSGPHSEQEGTVREWYPEDPLTLENLPVCCPPKLAERIATQEIQRVAGTPPLTPSPEGGQKISKNFSEISENPSEIPHGNSRKLVLEPLVEADEPPDGYRVVPPLKADGKLERLSDRMGRPGVMMPMDYLLNLVGSEPPETMEHGAARAAWEMIRQKAAVALLPYFYPKLAPVEAEESVSSHEAALDELE